MKLLIINIILLLSFNSFTQSNEVSVYLTTTKRYADLGLQIEAIHDGYIILTASICTKDFKDCLGLIRINEAGDTIWTTNHGHPNDDLHPSGKSMIIKNNSIIVAGRFRKNNHWQLKLMSFDLDGNLLREKDIFIPNEEIYLNGMIDSKDGLTLYGNGLFDGQLKVFYMKVNYQFDLLITEFTGNPNMTTPEVSLQQLSQGGYISAYSEYNNDKVGERAIIERLDEEFNVLRRAEMLQTRINYSTANILTVDDDKGYILAWHDDYRDSVKLRVYPYPTAIYKLDTFFNIEWEYVFVDARPKTFYSISKTKDDKIIGCGIHEFYNERDPIVGLRAADGWVFLIDQEGELIWERTITDTSGYILGRLWYGIETDHGFAFTGDFDFDNPDRDPFRNDAEVWLLTLDKNGCWNGNCNEFIIITGDSTSTSYIRTSVDLPSDKEVLNVRTYPNPSQGIITIEVDPEINKTHQRSIQISNMQGKVISSYDLRATKSTIDMTNLNPGMYIVTFIYDGVIKGNKKIIISP